MDDMNADHAATIRSYRSQDLEACRSLWVELTEWHRHIYLSPGIGGSEPGRQFDALLQRVGSEYIWVAEIDGQVIGLAGLILDEDTAELEPLIISKPLRGKGIGRQLAESVIQAARASGVKQLTVRPVARNEPAIRFFHEMGFDVVGQIELFMDFSPANRQLWKAGERIADREFRI